MGGEVRPPSAPTARDADKSSPRLLHVLPGVFRQSSSEWIDDNAQRLGASVAFYTLLSLTPVIVIAVAVAAVVFGQEAAQGRLAWDIRDVAGPDVARTIQEIIKGANEPRTSMIAILLGLVTLVIGASTIFVELHDAMNIIWHVSLAPGRTNAATFMRLIRERMYSFAAVLGIGFLLLVSLALNACIAAARIAVPRAASFVISYLIITVLFAALYKIVPDVSLEWSDVALGAALTAFLFTVGKQLIGLYFATTGLGSAYSAASSPIVVLLWVYYSAQIFFWGAEFSKVFTQTVGSQSGREL